MIYAGTGHRPDKLGGYTRRVDDALRELATVALKKHRPTLVLSGMALGWDMALAEAALEQGIPFVACIPFEGQESRWPPISRTRYNRLRYRAHEIVIVTDGGFTAEAMKERNRYMVNNSDAMFALWNGERIGGTAHCVAYAERQGKQIVNLWDTWKRDYAQSVSTPYRR